MNPMRVLLVDDEIALASALATVLAEDGHDTDVATSVADAEARFRARRFDVVVTDLRLPDGSGLDLLTRLRATGAPFHAVVATGLGGYEDALGAIRLRVGAFLTKPFAIAELRAAIAEAAAAPSPERETSVDARSAEAGVGDAIAALGERLDALGVAPAARLRVLSLAEECLRNAARHAYPEEPGPLRATVEREGDQLVLRVADRGCGFDVAAALAEALAAGRDRDPGLLRLHREADGVRIDSRAGQGTEVTLRFHAALANAPCTPPASDRDGLAVALLWS